jgi:uncharacterized protein
LTRAVFDPNVITAAAIKPEGVPARCLRGHAEGRFELIVSPLLLAELGEVLAREKFRAFLTEAHSTSLVAALARDGVMVDDPTEREAISRDPHDDYLIALARVASAHVLVTGDSDLLGVGVSGLRILAPKDFLDRLPP